MQKQLSDRDRVIKYKWEFLRRNPDYKKDYNNRHKFIDSKAPYLEMLKNRHFYKKYGIAFVFDPNLSYENLSKEINLKKGFDLTKDIFEWALDAEPSIIIDGVSDVPVSKIVDDLIEDSVRDEIEKIQMKNVVTLHMQVNLLRNETDLKNHFEKLIKFWKKTTKSTQWAMFDTYLQIWDYRNPKRSKKLTFAKIAEKVYPQDSGKGIKSNILSAERKVIRNYNSCESLIKGGYKHIQ